MTPNRLDQFIGWFNPRAQARRVAYRRLVSASYEGAKVTRRTAGWITSGNSANAEIQGDLTRLRERARSLVRDSPYAAKAKREWISKTVGYGIRANWADPKMQGAWDSWSSKCSADGLPHFEAIQALVAGAIFESGEVLVRFRPREAQFGVTPPLQLQVIESDWLDSTKTNPVDGGYAVLGIDFDLIGRRRGYWLYGQHPGDPVITGTRGGLSLSSQFIPADEILHVFETERPGQVRGVTKFAPVMLALRDMDDWMEAEQVRKKTESCLAAFVTSPEGEAFAISQQTTTNGVLVEQFEPGMVTRLRPGEDVKIAQPAQAGGLTDAERMFARRISAGLAMPYELMTGDLSQTNYSSYRSGLLAFRDVVAGFQWNVLIPGLCDPVAREFARAMKIADGSLKTQVQWAPPPFDLLDREAEAKADELELQIGKRSWIEMQSSLGNDPEAKLAEIESTAERLRAAGVTFGGKVAPLGQAQAAI